MSFKKGDRLEVDDLKQGGNWQIARSVATGQEGMIPVNFIVAQSCVDREG